MTPDSRRDVPTQPSFENVPGTGAVPDVTNAKADQVRDVVQDGPVRGPEEVVRFARASRIAKRIPAKEMAKAAVPDAQAKAPLTGPLAFADSGAVFNDQYEVIRHLSEGGQGAVFRVRDSTRVVVTSKGSEGSFLDGHAVVKMALPSAGGDPHEEAVLSGRLRTDAFVRVEGPYRILQYYPSTNPKSVAAFRKAFPGSGPRTISGAELDALADADEDFRIFLNTQFLVMDEWGGTAEDAALQSRLLSDAAKLRNLLVDRSALEAHLASLGYLKSDIPEIAAIILDRPALLEQLAPFGTLVGMALDAAQALHYLHHRHVPALLHRDVKPDNILYRNLRPAEIRSSGRLREYALCDLGISDTIQAKQGERPAVGGTPCHIPPEAFRYNSLGHIDGRWDVFALGVTLYELAHPAMGVPYPVDGRKIEYVEDGVLKEMPFAVPYADEQPDGTFPVFPTFDRLFGRPETVDGKKRPGFKDAVLAPLRARSPEALAELLHTRAMAPLLMRDMVMAMLQGEYDARMRLTSDDQKDPGVLEYLATISAAMSDGSRGAAIYGLTGDGAKPIVDFVGPEDQARIRSQGGRTDNNLGTKPLAVVLKKEAVDRGATRDKTAVDDEPAADAKSLARRTSQFAMRQLPPERQGRFGQLLGALRGLKFWK